MKYMALIYAAADAGPQRDTPEFGQMMADYGAATETFRNDGVMVSGEPLEPTASATSVRIRGGQTETMDGPFAETKERLGGFYIFECDSQEEAVRYASMIPTAKFGTIEVRKVMDLG